MQDCSSIPAKMPVNKRKAPTFLQVLVELMTGFEPVTSSLPRELEHKQAVTP